MPVQPENSWKLFMRIYVKGWKMLLAAMLTAFAVTYLVVSSRPAQYAAEAEVKVIPFQTPMSEEKFLDQIAAPFASDLLSPQILGEAVEELGLEGYLGVSRERAMREVADHTRIYWKRGELSCRISVTSEEARLSAQLAGSLVRAFVRNRIQDLLLTHLPESPDLNTLTAAAQSLGSQDLLDTLPLFKQDPAIRKTTAQLVLLESLAASMRDGKVSGPERLSAETEIEAMRARLATQKERALKEFRRDRMKRPQPDYRIEIVRDGAEPVRLRTNDEALLYFGAGLLTLLITSCWLYFLSLLNRRIYSARDLERYGIHFSYLGAVPRVARKAGLGGVSELLAYHGSRTDLDDCFRYLRVAINFVASPGMPKVLPVTSGMAGEGKTFVACHLAASMALDRNRTLLVDCDFRNPALQDVFQIRRGEGLSNYLLESVDWESLVLPSGIAQLDVMAAGTRGRTAFMQLESEKMQQLIEAVKKRYDRVVLHSPCLDRGGFEVIRAVGQFVLVAQAGRVTAEILRHAEHLTGPNVRALGLILNYQAAAPADVSYESYMYHLKIMPPEETL